MKQLSSVFCNPLGNHSDEFLLLAIIQIALEVKCEIQATIDSLHFVPKESLQQGGEIQRKVILAVILSSSSYR
jgi:hypothetical protein